MVQPGGDLEPEFHEDTPGDDGLVPTVQVDQYDDGGLSELRGETPVGGGAATTFIGAAATYMVVCKPTLVFSLKLKPS